MLPVLSRRPVVFFTGGLVFACLALGCSKPPPPPGEESHPAPVKAVAVETATFGEWTELLGATQPLPDRMARVSAGVEGHVLSVLGDGKEPAVAEGQRVKTGQVIARLDDRIARANRAKFAAQLEDVDEQKKQAGFVIDLAEIEVKRLGELRRTTTNGTTPLVSRVELEKAEIALKEARSKQQAVAARETALRAELKALDVQLEFYTLKAPIAGTLGLLQIVAGQTLTPGATVAEIIDLDEIDAVCFAPPDTARRLDLKQTTAVFADRKTPVGKVVFISENAQAETGNFVVKVRFPNRESGLRANRVVRVNVQTQPEKPRLVIPVSALLEDQDPPAVVVVRDVEKKKDKEGKEEKLGKALKVQATLGVRDREHDKVEVLGLETADKKEKIAVNTDVLVVTEGAHGLQDGDVVKLKEEAAGK